jgi:hypothetical protein
MENDEIKKYLDREDLQIEGNICTYHLAAEGTVSGTFRGIFKFKCFLSPSEKLACGRLYRKLLGPNAALAFKNEDDLAYTLSQLTYRIVSAPPFWSSSIGVDGQVGDIDENVLNIISEAASAAELKYWALLQEKRDQTLKSAKESAEKFLAQKDGELDPPEEA